jgi:hypothetical protein
MTTTACFYYKVNRFLIIIVSNTFDELLLHYDVCWLSFSEILTWIKKGARHTWKAWRTKEFDWGQVQVFHTSSTRPPRHFWPKDGKRSRPTHFGRWFRTARLGKVATDATSSYGLRLGRSLYGWKDNLIELPMAPVSCENSI